MFRGFIAVDVDDLPLINNFMGELRESGAQLKLVEKENLHLTLKFLGDTREDDIDKIEEIMRESLVGVKPFKILLKDVGFFPGRNYIKIVWIGVENGEKLVKIAESLNEKLEKLGFKREKKGFVPHLTIARVKSSKNKDELLKVVEKYRGIIFGEQEIKDIKLFRSDLTPKGPVYSVVREINIKD